VFSLKKLPMNSWFYGLLFDFCQNFVDHGYIPKLSFQLEGRIFYVSNRILLNNYMVFMKKIFSHVIISMKSFSHVGISMVTRIWLGTKIWHIWIYNYKMVINHIYPSHKCQVWRNVLTLDFASTNWF
jgi:hypothetical protein